jgi:hypothetical protein
MEANPRAMLHTSSYLPLWVRRNVQRRLRYRSRRTPDLEHSRLETDRDGGSKSKRFIKLPRKDYG